MIKDKYGNNIRRGARVKDLSDKDRGEGEVKGTHSRHAVIEWDTGEGGILAEGKDLVLVKRGHFG